MTEPRTREGRVLLSLGWSNEAREKIRRGVLAIEAECVAAALAATPAPAPEGAGLTPDCICPQSWIDRNTVHHPACEWRRTHSAALAATPAPEEWEQRHAICRTLGPHGWGNECPVYRWVAATPARDNPDPLRVIEAVPANNAAERDFKRRVHAALRAALGESSDD